MSDVEWIIEGLKKPGKSQTGLAKALGRAPSAITSLLKGTRELKAREIPIVKEYLESAPPPPKQTKIIHPSGPEQSEVTKVSEGWPNTGERTVSVRGVAVGGDDGFFYFGDVIDRVKRPPGIANAKDVEALNVAGESMAPRFGPGELIYIQLRPPAPGDDIVVEIYPEKEGDQSKGFLKRLVRRTGLRLYCQQFNPPADIEFDMGEVKNVWRVLTLRDLLG
ncbi:putative phage repressor [Nitrobacter hamburgensis X14]|uniref:Putative phage repressor n=1 Tax=Nitrobacter hamburgensis (strain DSM 10229 / NCIMB 13809 / X14) TaxID=323097 RepID=Q1QKQ1_NITHX|nr:helix-turn-helix transcriptional regulator [Nitrobacter hamburgensis]ABE63196.1 putative phage repressor [Nitrobacter hamburgensis X14]